MHYGFGLSVGEVCKHAISQAALENVIKIYNFGTFGDKDELGFKIKRSKAKVKAILYVAKKVEAYASTAAHRILSNCY